MGLLLREEKENLLIEYNLLHEEIMDRGYKTWVINSILIIGSALVALNPVIENFPSPILSVLLVVSALILHATSERITAIAYSRLDEIARELRIIGPTKTYESKVSGQWWYVARRNVAYVLFTVLIGIYLFLILHDFYVLAITIVAGFLTILIRERGVPKGKEQLRWLSSTLSAVTHLVSIRERKLKHAKESIL